MFGNDFALLEPAAAAALVADVVVEGLNLGGCGGKDVVVAAAAAAVKRVHARLEYAVVAVAAAARAAADGDVRRG